MGMDASSEEGSASFSSGEGGSVTTGVGGRVLYGGGAAFGTSVSAAGAGAEVDGDDDDDVEMCRAGGAVVAVDEIVEELDVGTTGLVVDLRPPCEELVLEVDEDCPDDGVLIGADVVLAACDAS